MSTLDADDPSARPAPISGRIIAAAAFAASVALQMAGLWIATEGAAGWEWAGVIAAQIGAAGLGAEGLAQMRGSDDPATQREMHRTGWVIGLAFPLLGPFALVLLGLTLPSRTTKTHLLESAESLRSQAASAALERRRGEQQLDTSLAAIVDSLKDRDPKVRVAAIDALAGESSKRATKLLAEARQNTIFDVRVRAVTALGRIAKEQSDRLAAARRALAQDPKSPALHREVARICFDYAQLGIEDPRMSRLLIVQARTHAKAAFDLGDKHRETSLILARASNELGLHEEAELAYRRLLLKDDRDTAALLGVAEAQFARRAFALLPLTCRWVLHQAGRNLDEGAIDALKFWVRGEGIAKARSLSATRSMTRT